MDAMRIVALLVRKTEFNQVHIGDKVETHVTQKIETQNNFQGARQTINALPPEKKNKLREALISAGLFENANN